MSTVRLNISLGDLEALLAKHEGLELELSQNIMQAFADKHLKSLFNSDTGKAIAEAHRQASNALVLATRTAIEKEIGTVKTDWNGRVTDVTLRPEMQQEIVKIARSAVREKINEVLSSYEGGRLDSLREETEQLLVAQLDTRFTRGLVKMVSDEVDHRLKLVAEELAKGRKVT